MAEIFCLICGNRERFVTSRTGIITTPCIVSGNGSLVSYQTPVFSSIDWRYSGEWDAGLSAKTHRPYCEVCGELDPPSVESVEGYSAIFKVMAVTNTLRQLGDATLKVLMLSKTRPDYEKDIIKKILKDERKTKYIRRPKKKR